MPSYGLTAFRKAVTSAANAAKDLAIQAKDEISLAPKSLKDYNVGQQVATAGPEGLWKIFAAEYKKKGWRSLSIRFCNHAKSVRIAFGKSGVRC